MTRHLCFCIAKTENLLEGFLPLLSYVAIPPPRLLFQVEQERHSLLAYIASLDFPRVANHPGTSEFVCTLRWIEVYPLLGGKYPLPASSER